MYSDRRDRLREQLGLTAGEGAVVSYLPDIRWITGFSGSSGMLVLWDKGEILITDGRYTTQVASECPNLPVHIGQGSPAGHIETVLEEHHLTSVRIQAQHATWGQVKDWQESWKGTTIVPLGGVLDDLRSVKDDDEVQIIRSALDITEKVFEEVLSRLEEGVSENEIAAEIDYLQRRRGASGSAFDTIVAFSENAALPHARPGNRTLKRGDVILMDFGCVVDGYHSDMTRTVSFGSAGKDFLEAYEAVRSALLRAQEDARAGITGEQLDGVARDALTQRGYGTAFSHSLGHGVGLEIHESPSVSRRNQQSLQAGSIITLEPGVYLPGHFGIRIENMAHLTGEGCVVLNQLETDLIRL